jgi:hypothetical protein
LPLWYLQTPHTIALLLRVYIILKLMTQDKPIIYSNNPDITQDKPKQQ